MVKKYLSFLMILLIYCLCVYGNSNDDITSPSEMLLAINHLRNNFHAMREFNLKNFKSDDPLWKETEKVYLELTKDSDRIDSDFNDALLIYKAESLMIMGKDQEALNAIEEIQRNNTDICEALIYKTWLVYEKDNDEVERNKRFEVQDKYFSLLPVINGGMAYDPDKLIRGTSDFLVIPKYPDNGWSMFTAHYKIGSLYEEMGYYREAIDNYIEAYWSDRYGNPNEIKRDALWIKIGDLEARDGQKSLAYRAYLKATYLGREYIDLAAKGIYAVMEGKVKLKYPITEPKYDIPKVQQIAELYRQMNLHPLALSILVKAQKETGVSLKEQENKIREEWKELVDKCASPGSLGPKCKILGWTITEVKDWAEVPIIRPSDTFWKPINK